MANPAQHGQSDSPAGLATTLGELRASGYKSRSVKEELRQNLIRKLEADEPKFEGIVGFEETVVPQVENALLSGQDIIFLGERGQAKTRLARTLPALLDEFLPMVGGCEINDDPLKPICWNCRTLLDQCGDDTPISWLPRDRRYGEKLATPDITIADLIGEVDPIKVAEGRYLSDELTISAACRARTAGLLLGIARATRPHSPGRILSLTRPGTSARLTIANNLPPTVKTDQRLAKGKPVITVAAGPDAPMCDTVRYHIRGADNAGLRPVHFDPHELCESKDDQAHVRTIAEVERFS